MKKKNSKPQVVKKPTPRQRENIERFKRTSSPIQERQKAEARKPSSSWWMENFEGEKEEAAKRMRG